MMQHKNAITAPLALFLLLTVVTLTRIAPITHSFVLIPSTTRPLSFLSLHHPPTWTDSFLETFSGDFDNYDQVVADRLQGLEPREGGGHEHIHCTLIPLSSSERLAAFYFDGNPNKIFRFRYYKLLPTDDDNVIDMTLYTLQSDLELLLRKESNPLHWVELFNNYSFHNKTILLPKCNVQWSTTPDPIQHAYHDDTNSSPGFHAVMTFGEALIESQMMPGVQILVKDQLSLYDNEFWIHDRGYNPTTMAFIYGNQRLVPYQLKRVSQLKDDSESSKRRMITDPNLQWTLGPDYRTEEEYQDKLKRIGGVSSQINKPKT